MTSRVVKTNVRELPIVTVPTYVGKCCREWVLALGFKGRCGLCGEVPVFLRRDDD